MTIQMFEIAGGWWFAADPENTHTDAFGDDRTVGVLLDIVEGRVQPSAHVSSNIPMPLLDKVQGLARHFGSAVVNVYSWDDGWSLFLRCRS